MSMLTFVSPCVPRHSLCRNRNSLRSVHPRRRRVWRAALSSDFYEILGIDRNANNSTIKRAYRRAALKNHPDVSKAPDAKERFMRVQEAYSVLSDSSTRASYDRRSQSGYSSSSSSAWPGGSAGPNFDPTEFAKKWREQNPMPKDLNDSFGSIFSDLFSGVAGAASGATRPGIMDDFVDFLENQVDGFGVDSSGYASDDENDGLSDILKSSDVDVLQAEIDDAHFVLQQLETRQSKLDEEAASLQKRADEWRVRANRAEGSMDYTTRDTAKERASDLKAEAKRFSSRSRKTLSHIKKQRDRLKKIEKRLEKVNSQKKREEPSKPRASVDTQETQRDAIDDELERMKRELGL